MRGATVDSLPRVLVAPSFTKGVENVRTNLLLVAACMLAISTPGWAVTATCIWDDFNGIYIQYPSSGGDFVEEHFSTDVWVSFAYNYEKEPGPPDEYNTGRQLPPHTGTDSCQRFRVYQQAGSFGWLSHIKVVGDGFGGVDCEVDLVNLAQARGWLPIDLSKDVTVSIWVLGNNTSVNPDRPESRFWSNIYCVNNNGAPMRGGGWEAGGSWAETDWNSTTNGTWRKLSVVLHPADLVAGRRAGVTLINGIGPFGDADPYFTFWGDPSGTARSTTLWENLSLTYTPLAGSLPTTIGVAKSKADGTPVDLTGKIVTAVFPLGADDRVYIEEQDRSAAISAILKEGASQPDMNTKCNVTGHIESDEQTNERYLADAEFGTGAPQEVKPIAIGNVGLGGVGIVSHGAPSDRGYGADNTGMLVRAFGRIIAMSDASDPNFGDCLYVDDGSNVAADYHWYLDGGTWMVTAQDKGVKVYCYGAFFTYSVGQYVSVTGVLGLRATDALKPPPAHGITYRSIYTRAGDDVSVIPEH